MLNRCILSFLCVCFSFTHLAAQQLPAGTGIGNATKPHTVVYKLKGHAVTQQPPAYGRTLQEALQRVGAKAVQQKFPQKSPTHYTRKAHVDLSLIYELTYEPSKSLEEVQQVLMASGLVEYVEPLYERVPLYQPNDPASDSTKTTQAYLKLIQAYGAWAVQKGDTNIIIGILDTGFRLTHEDIRNKIKYNHDDPIDGIDNDGDGLVDNFVGWDFADRDNNTHDDTPYRGHGVAVAGTAIGEADNGIGIAGTGFNTKFMPLKVFPSTSTGSFGGYEAIVYAADKGCSIINLSWGGEGSSKYEQDIINYAVFDRDVVIVASGGNTNAFVNIFPAAYDNVLSVGGINKDIKTNNHTWNYKIDLTAPSASVYTTTISRDNSYGGGTGTSYASPQVAGAAALLRSHLPHLNAMQVMERLRATSDDIYHLPENAPYFEKLGKGRLNMKRALLETGIKSVRCTSFGIADDKVAQIGDTLLLHINLTNYLDPTTALAVKLTSPSPFIKIVDDALTVGAMASLSSRENQSTPFRFVVQPDAPLNALATFRLGFIDGTYQDFQYFQIPVNPDYITLTANNLHMTLNSKGNIGYNGYNFRQGIGITYKGSNSMLFEGGLLIASAPDRISDNVRNASWQTDNDFVPQQPIRMRYNQPYKQEVHGLMKDKFPAPGQAGVAVSYKGMAWSEDPDADYIILEYLIQNITPDTIHTLHAGIFADWNIGDPYLNIADWDEQTQMGYVYNKGYAATYAGIKLLTYTPPSYYAIDNLSGGSSTFAIADGFNAQEKYRTLSGGISRKRAWGNGNGNDVSHVVGTTAQQLSPGETQLVAFAIVAGDDLERLRDNAKAAQMQFLRLKAGPTPLAISDTVCIGTSLHVAPSNGKRFKFYADEAKTNLIATGPSLELLDLSQNVELFVCNADSVIDSPLVPIRVVVANTPEAGFSIAQEEEIQVGKRVAFRNETKHGDNWMWHFGNGDTSTEKEPSYTYSEPGKYEVLLVAGSNFGCSEDSVIQQIEVIKAQEAPNVNASQFQLYPNPATHELRVTLPTANAALTLYMTDSMGRRIAPPVLKRLPQEAMFDLSGMAEGLYIVQLTCENTTLIKRLVVIRP
ncbi:S8 family serine peptidase [uncultured Pontibacter sp.]|uniref:S8 family serine peptidase n=1 Tax=uncultured Pontibacter sp. TaxID=453356 RepID=UPI0026116F50|nr:S8 family serine peptidase [uncultured Pontibacter sp.]